MNQLAKDLGSYLEDYENFLHAFNWTEARDVLEAGLVSCPQSYPVAVALAEVYDKLNDPERAEATYKNGIRLNSSLVVKYGEWLQHQGRFKDSEAILRSAIEADPSNGLAYLALAEGNFLSWNEPELERKLVGMVTESTTDPLNRTYICYAIGKIHDRCKNFKEAARYFQIANDSAFDLFIRGRAIDHKIFKNYPRKIATIYSRETLESLRSIGSEDSTPVFIVGMIRSGTTLLNQIVCAHPEVASAGELSFWKTVADKFNHKWYTSGIETRIFKEFQTEYLQALRSCSRGTRYVIDKMPLNFELLGMIHLAFPRAKILHIRRNAADTCLSIFQNYYGGGPNFTYNWDNLFVYYSAYLNFMELWRQALPEGSIYELDYENLVLDKELTVRSLIEFLDLDWDDRCLHPESNLSVVATPSKWQVRQPIHNNSIEKWRKYSRYFSPLLRFSELQHPAPSKL